MPDSDIGVSRENDRIENKFQFLLQKLNFLRDSFKKLLHTKTQVRIISNFPVSDGIVMAGDDLGYVWTNYRSGKEHFHGCITAAVQRFGPECPANGCIRCHLEECFYADFIRNYVSYPRSD